MDRRRDGDIPLSFATPTGKALAYVYFEEELGRRAAGNLLTRSEIVRCPLNGVKKVNSNRQSRLYVGTKEPA